MFIDKSVCVDRGEPESLEVVPGDVTVIDVVGSVGLSSDKDMIRLAMLLLLPIE